MRVIGDLELPLQNDRRVDEDPWRQNIYHLITNVHVLLPDPAVWNRRGMCRQLAAKGQGKLSTSWFLYLYEDGEKERWMRWIMARPSPRNCFRCIWRGQGRLPYRARFSGLIRRGRAVQARHSLDYIKLFKLSGFSRYTKRFRGSVWRRKRYFEDILPVILKGLFSFENNGVKLQSSSRMVET